MAMNIPAIFLLLYSVGSSNLVADETAKGNIAEIFSQKYWSGQIKPETLTVKNGDGRRMEMVFTKTVVISKGSEKVVICKRSKVRFTGAEIYYIEANSAGCKVGDLEAVEGTTIEFWEDGENTLRSIKIAKSTILRGYTWPAQSTLYFDNDEDRKPRLYAALLGADLKGTQFTSGQKVYVGRIIDDTGRRNDELSLVGEDPTL
ncbi:MAG: hypothetical protein IT288_11800 [Bdellovibrionales bacterium]|nr:hypothetical protein [Bdellovibrionales bacterium]